jgi:hypothetical protein
VQGVVEPVTFADHTRLAFRSRHGAGACAPRAAI